MDSNSVIVIKEAINMITTFGAGIISGLVTGGFILLAAYIAYKGGLQTYFMKRQHEQIMKRYLEEGVDRVSSAVAEVSRVYVDNNLKALTILNNLRIYDRVGQLDKFERFDRRHLDPGVYYKISNLIGDNIIWHFIALFLSFVDVKTNVLDIDFLTTVAGISKDHINRKKTVEKIEKILGKDVETFGKFELLLDELQKIASILERATTLTWADLSEFKNRIEIKESVKRIKQRYAEIKKIQAQQMSKNNK